MKIAFLMRPDPSDPDAPEVNASVSELSGEIVEGLRVAGAEVEEVVPEAEAWDLLTLKPRHDLYVVKSKNPLDLDLAESLERAGGRAINTAQASRLAKDKIVHTTLLARAAVPQPDSWTVASFAALGALLERVNDECLVKPPSGSMQKGIYALRSVGDLKGDEERELRDAFVDKFGQPRPLLVQRKVPSDGTDLNIYVVGDWAAAIERPVGAKTEAEMRGTAVELLPAVRDAALACGRAMGLELYGVDVTRAPSGDWFWVVDVNAFPSYRRSEKGLD